MSGIISQKEMISSLEINFVPVVDVLGNVRKSTKKLKSKNKKGGESHNKNKRNFSSIKTN